MDFDLISDVPADEQEAANELAAKLEKTITSATASMMPRFGLGKAVSIAQTATCMVMAANISKLARNEDQEARLLDMTVRSIRNLLPTLRALVAAHVAAMPVANDHHMAG